MKKLILLALVLIPIQADAEWQETIDLKTGNLIRYEDHGSQIYKQELGPGTDSNIQIQQKTFGWDENSNNNVQSNYRNDSKSQNSR